MSHCLVCGASDLLFYRCSYCDGTFCPDHRLPEKHDCDGVEFLSPPGKRFRAKSTGRVVEQGDPIKRPEPMEVEYTVGTRPEPDYPSSPPVTLRSEADSPDEEPPTSVFARIVSWLRRAT